MNSSRESPENLLGRAIGSFIISQAVYVAAKLRIADRLSDGPKSAAELAQEAAVHPRALFRFLRALSSAGIFCEGENETFSLNAAANLLRSGIPGSYRPWALMTGEEWVRRPWSNVMQSVGSNASAFDAVFGVRPFEYMSAHPAAAQIFDEAMTQGTLSQLAPILNAGDFSRFKTIADIGGGNGFLLREILRTAPASTGILFDLPAVIERARELLQSEAMDRRCRLVPGNFFEGLPSANAFILKWILHNWDDDRASRILENCRAALPDGGRILIIERIVSGPNVPCEAKMLDLNMLVSHGGCERTDAEYRALIERAGLRVVSVTPAGPVFVIEAAHAGERR